MPVLVNDSDFSTQGYVAPTVFLKADKYLSNYNYYGSLQGAIDKYNYLHNLPGGKNTTPVGIRSFINNQTAQTFGINCDFYTLQGSTWELTSYSWLKSKSVWPPMVFRFISVTGSGTYYSIFDPYYFSISAIAVSTLDPNKLRELDLFWREVQIMKYRYNSFVGFLNVLSQKELNSIEQRTFNEGLLILQSLSNEMQQIRGVSIQYQNGKVGLPVLVLIALVVVLSVATAWTINSIATEREKTKRINDSYDLQKWVVNKKLEIAQQVNSGQISQASADSINATLDNAAQLAEGIAKDAAKPKTNSLDSVVNILKWGVIGYGVFTIFNLVKQKKVSNG